MFSAEPREGAADISVPRAIATTLAMTLSARMMLGTEAGRRASKMIVADIDVWRVANMIIFTRYRQ